MASLPGFRFDLTGASGTLGVLSPMESWRAYILPRGGSAAQDSTGALITFDSAAVASRFAANVWIQAGLSTANIRQVSAVGGDSISVSGANLTVSENDRIFLIGTTQPTVSGGSATYTTPDTVIRQRDDNTGSTFSNSQITSNSDGLIQGFAETNFYDAIIQDGNQANQGSIIDLPVGVVEGVSVSTDALFGASLTVNGAFGVTGWATFGSTVTMNAQLGVTGHATFGSTITGHANFGITGTAVIGTSLTVGGSATIGASLSVVGTFSATTMPRVRVYFNDSATTGESFTSSDNAVGSSNVVTWASVLYDVGNMFNSGNSSFITVPETGMYLLDAGLLWVTVFGGWRLLEIVHGTSDVTIAETLVTGTSTTTGIFQNLSVTMYATAGTTFHVTARQSSGVSLGVINTSDDEPTHFSAVKLS